MTRRYPVVVVNGRLQELSTVDRIYNSSNVTRAASDPAGAVEGDMYVKTTDNSLKVHDGYGFVTMAQPTAAVVDGGNFANGSSIVSVSGAVDGGNFT